MKSFTQVVVPVAIVVCLVAGVTFVRQYYAAPSPPPTPTPSPANPKTATGLPLQLPVTIVQWNPEYAGEFEANVPGHYDFWFENPKDVVVKLGVNRKNCKCSKAEVCIFTPEEGVNYKEWHASALAAVAGKDASTSADLLQLFALD